MGDEIKLSAFLLGLLCGQFVGFVTAVLAVLLSYAVANRVAVKKG